MDDQPCTSKDCLANDNLNSTPKATISEEEIQKDAECLNFRLEDCAKKYNLSSLNVKNIIFHIIKDPNTLAALLNGDSGAIESLKLTRSRLREIEQIAQTKLNIELKPVNANNNRPTFLDFDFDDNEEDDLDYQPPEETQETDKYEFDDFTEEELAAENSFDTGNWFGHDISDQVRGICMDPEYAEFIQECNNPTVNLEDNWLDENDEDYNIVQDDEEMLDRDEFRNDRSTKISKRELRQLYVDIVPDELLLEEPPFKKSKAKRRLSFGSRSTTPGSITNINHQGSSTSTNFLNCIEIMDEDSLFGLDGGQKRNPKEEALSEKPENLSKSWSLLRAKSEMAQFSEDEIRCLRIQMEKHVQLLTQHIILTSDIPELMSTRNKAVRMMHELDKNMYDNAEISIFRIQNLPEAVITCHEIESFNDKNYELNDEDVKSKFPETDFSYKTAMVLSKSLALSYPELLPTIRPQLHQNTLPNFLTSEQMLLALALFELHNTPHSTGGVGRLNTSKYQTISTYFLPNKTPIQIRNHLKNVRSGSMASPIHQLIIFAEQGKFNATFELDSGSTQLQGRPIDWTPSNSMPRWLQTLQNLRSMNQPIRLPPLHQSNPTPEISNEIPQVIYSIPTPLTPIIIQPALNPANDESPQIIYITPQQFPIMTNNQLIYSTSESGQLQLVYPISSSQPIPQENQQVYAVPQQSIKCESDNQIAYTPIVQTANSTPNYSRIQLYDGKIQMISPIISTPNKPINVAKMNTNLSTSSIPNSPFQRYVIANTPTTSKKSSKVRINEDKEVIVLDDLVEESNEVIIIEDKSTIQTLPEPNLIPGNSSENIDEEIIIVDSTEDDILSQEINESNMESQQANIESQNLMNIESQQMDSNIESQTVANIGSQNFAIATSQEGNEINLEVESKQEESSKIQSKLEEPNEKISRRAEQMNRCMRGFDDPEVVETWSNSVLQTVYNLVKQRLFMHEGKFKTFLSVLSNCKKSSADKYDELSKLLRETQPELADCIAALMHDEELRVDQEQNVERCAYKNALEMMMNIHIYFHGQHNTNTKRRLLKLIRDSCFTEQTLREEMRKLLSGRHEPLWIRLRQYFRGERYTEKIDMSRSEEVPLQIFQAFAKDSQGKRRSADLNFCSEFVDLTSTSTLNNKPNLDFRSNLRINNGFFILRLDDGQSVPVNLCSSSKTDQVEEEEAQKKSTPQVFGSIFGPEHDRQILYGYNSSKANPTKAIEKFLREQREKYPHGECPFNEENTQRRLEFLLDLLSCMNAKST